MHSIIFRDPTKTKQYLTNSKKNTALKTAKELLPGSGLLPLIVKFLRKLEPFNNFFVQDDIKNVKSIDC